MVQTAANVKENAATATTNKKLTDTAGEAISAGDLIYKLSSDSKMYRALNDTAAHAAHKGMAINSAATGQPVTYQYEGDVDPGATVAVGEVYGVSVNAGKVAQVGDLASTKFRSIFGVGLTTSTIRIGINNTGIQKA